MRKLFSTLCERAELEQALSTLKQHQRQRIRIASPLCARAVSLCNKLGCIHEGKWVYDLIKQNGLPIEPRISNTLLSMHIKSGSVSEAAQIFDSITQRNVITWTVMISAYADNGQFSQAFHLLRELGLEGLKLDLCALRVLLTLYASSGALDEGRFLHSEIREMETGLIVGNLLINMYGKCRCVDEAWEVFVNMRDRNVVSWTSMVAAFASNGEFSESLRLFREMVLAGCPRPNPVTFVVALDGCERSSDVTALHAQAAESGCVDLLVATTLVDVFGKCGASHEARLVFDEIPLEKRTAVSWTTMVSAYVESDEIHKALEIYRTMLLEGVKPTLVTFVMLIGSSSSSSSHELSFLEDHVVECGFGEAAFAGNAFIAMHARCHNLSKARQAFDRIKMKDMVSWNTMLSAYAQGGESHNTFELLRILRLEGLKQTDYTFIAALTACTREEFLHEGELLHGHVKQCGFEKETLLSALVSMYGRCGKVSAAEELFTKMAGLGKQRVPLWNSLIILCVQKGDTPKALELFSRMKLEGLKPDAVTYTSVLNACSSGADLVRGKRLHVEINECGTADLAVGNALLDMYGKCGKTRDAEEIFDKMVMKNVISWTAMLAMHAQHGQSKLCIKTFFKMQQDGVRPNEVTVTVVLFACSHGGLLREGYECFATLRGDYSVVPTPDHYTCMVDLLGRSGRVEEAEELLNRVPDVRANRVSLLSSCTKSGEVERAKRAACAQTIDSDSSMYVLLSQIYASKVSSDNMNHRNK